MGRKTRRKVERGIYRDEYGYSTVVVVHRKPLEKRWPPTAPLKVMRDWRQRTDAQLRRRAPATARGTLASDIARYLKLVRHLAGLDSVKATVEAWLPLLGTKPRWSITTEDVRRVMGLWAEEDVKPKTIANRLGALRRVYRVLDGRRAWSPVDDIDIPTSRSNPPVYISPALVRDVHAKLLEGEQAGTLRDAKTRARFLIRAASGIRPCELMRTQPRDVDLERRVWRTRDAKGGFRPGGLYLTDDLLAAWRVFIAADAWGEFNTGSMARVLRTAGWPEGVRPYNLRASLGIALSESGTDLADVASVLGHTSTDMTRSHYVPVLGSRVQEALERVGTRLRIAELVGEETTPAATPAGHPRMAPTEKRSESA